MLAAPLNDALRAVAPGACLDLNLVLLGGLNSRLTEMVQAVELAAEFGLGRERGRLTLETVLREHADGTIGRVAAAAPERVPVPPPLERVRLTLTTPLRLNQAKQLQTPERFAPQALLTALVRRLSLLCRLHGTTPIDADFKSLKQQAETICAFDAAWAWRDQKRYRAADASEVPVGGLVGQAVLDLREAMGLWPYLWLGQWVHVGKGAVMGMGGFRLTPP